MHRSNDPYYADRTFLRYWFYIQKMFTAIIGFISIFISHPLKSLKLIRTHKFRILVNAIKYETPGQIMANLKNSIYAEISPSYLGNEILFSAYDREQYLEEKKLELENFLTSDKHLEFSPKQPKLAIVIVLFNKAELTLACLQSIKKNTKLTFKLIIVDNNSSDQTDLLLQRIKGAVIIRNKHNEHFINACNQSLQYIKEDYLLFLNNDTEIYDGAIDVAFNELVFDQKCAAVGGKLILPDGFLQEAGSIIWSDGSCVGYGRGQLPYLPEFNFKRVVDYCSAAFLMTRTQLFRDHGGFDQNFAPAYYEETDYCLWLQENNYDVIYNPMVIARHFEFGSGKISDAIELHQKNQKLFYNKHNKQLNKHLRNGEPNELTGRYAASKHPCKKLLYIDDRVPHLDLGSGFPRSNAIVNQIQKMDYLVTIYPLTKPIEDQWESTYRDIDPSIEIIRFKGIQGFKEHIKFRLNYYDYIWISRPHNLQTVFRTQKQYAKNSRIIYDAEAIYAEREINRLKNRGGKINQSRFNLMIKNELTLAEFAETITVVSENDAEKFRKFGYGNVKVLGHSLKFNDSLIEFDQRKDLLFVGNLDDDASPNVDSIVWFTKEVWPLIRTELPDLKLNIVGSCHSSVIKSLYIGGVNFLGKLTDLTKFYANNRVFIAPTRFSAGIPYKIHEAAANGMPVVATKLLGNQLDWNDTETIILADPIAKNFAAAVIKLYTDRTLWEKIQCNSFKKIKTEASPENFIKTISAILE